MGFAEYADLPHRLDDPSPRLNDFPEPDGPINATNSPLWISISASFNAKMWNSARMYSLVTPLVPVEDS